MLCCLNVRTHVKSHDEHGGHSIYDSRAPSIPHIIESQADRLQVVVAKCILSVDIDSQSSQSYEKESMVTERNPPIHIIRGGKHVNDRLLVLVRSSRKRQSRKLDDTSYSTQIGRIATSERCWGGSNLEEAASRGRREESSESASCFEMHVGT